MLQGAARWKNERTRAASVRGLVHDNLTSTVKDTTGKFSQKYEHRVVLNVGLIRLEFDEKCFKNSKSDVAA